MRIWKLYVPAVPGALIENVKVTCCPGATDCEFGSITRKTLHVELSCGFWVPSLYVSEVQTVVPLFCIVTDTVACWPGCNELGTD